MTMVILLMISEPGCCSSFRPAEPTDLLYILGDKKPFTSPGTYNLEIIKADRLLYSEYVQHRQSLLEADWLHSVLELSCDTVPPCQVQQGL